MTFVEFASSHGLVIRYLESMKITRCPTITSPAKKNGAYLFDGVWGWVQNWASMLEPVLWKDASVTKPEDIAAMNKRMAAARKSQAKERIEMNRKAATKAAWILSQCSFEKHAYLDSHGFPDMTGLVWMNGENNLLVIPMRVGNELVGCQLIDRDGGKKFLFGQRCNGAEFIIGTSGIEIYCEGMATGLSIHAAMSALKCRCRIHVCFSAANMQSMAKSSSGFVVADNDVSGVGERVAIATGLPYYIPKIEGDDLNDEYRRDGVFATGMRLRQLISILEKPYVSKRSLTPQP